MNDDFTPRTAQPMAPAPASPVLDVPSTPNTPMPAISDIAIGAGLGLSADFQMAAWLDSSGFALHEIEGILGLERGMLLALRNKDSYREMVRRCVEIRAKSEALRSGDDLEGLFNDQINASVAALIAVRDNPYSKGSDRIKAATEFLDRAAKAPKTQKGDTGKQRTVIVLPVGELRNMRQALLEEGTSEDIKTYDLLKGVDFKDAPGDEQNAREGMINAQRG